ncbi:MAG: hypothetical protein KIT87_29240 [Anaerolineae bacterium]|nr:hypothetical protein [Anaerolineae bacterium]
MQDYGTTTRRQDQTKSGSSVTDNQSTVDQAKNVAGQAVDQAKSTASDVVDQAKSTAGQVVDQAKDVATTKISDQKEQAADSLGAVADTLRQTTQQLRGQNLGPLVGVADSAATQLEDLSRYLRDSNVDDLVRDVEGFARRQPVLFLSGAFALGLLAARFLKSSAPEPDYPDYYPQGYGQGGYGQNYGQNYGQGYRPNYPSSYSSNYGNRPAGTMGQTSRTGYGSTGYGSTGYSGQTGGSSSMGRSGSTGRMGETSTGRMGRTEE